MKKTTNKKAAITYVSTPGNYALSAAVLGEKLAQVTPDLERICLVPANTELTYIDIGRLNRRWQIQRVPHIPFPEGIKPTTPRWVDTLTKLRIWSLEDFAKVVYFDADCFPVVDVTPLTEMEPMAIGVTEYWKPEVLWFHSGLMVIKPDAALLENMLKVMHEEVNTHPKQLGLYGGDQTFLNVYFRQYYPGGRKAYIQTVFGEEWDVCRWDRWDGPVYVAHIRPHAWMTAPNWDKRRSKKLWPYTREWRAIASGLGWSH